MSFTDQGLKLYGSGVPEERKREAFTSGAVPVAVYGLGRMGLPLAAVFADVTGNVVGTDIDETLVRTVNRGNCPVDREPGLAQLVNDGVETGALTAVSDPERAARETAVHVVLVPTTPSDSAEGESVDLSALSGVTRDIAAGLGRGDLVVVESTVPPGTCSEVVLPTLERESGLSLGEFGLAHCPERTMSGRAIADIRGAYPRVVGGADEESTRNTVLVYEELSSNDVIPVSGLTTAEAVKVFEGVYRDVNIALANQLAQFTDELEIDVREAIDAANTQPFCDIHTPGPGVGGHCIPNYPQFLIRECETEAPLLRTAREVNEGMPAFTVRKLVEGLDAEGRDVADATVLVLGLTYRSGVPELSNSPALSVVSRLDDAGAEVLLVDPLIEDGADLDVGGRLVTLEAAHEYDVDGVVLATFHDEFADIDWSAFERSDSRPIVIDGRSALEPQDADLRFYRIGTG